VCRGQAVRDLNDKRIEELKYGMTEEVQKFRERELGEAVGENS
jgi:hypothetical protein